MQVERNDFNMEFIHWILPKRLKSNVKYEIYHEKRSNQILFKTFCLTMERMRKHIQESKLKVWPSDHLLKRLAQIEEIMKIINTSRRDHEDKEEWS